jgi:gliding motility-associated peptidyl-prolyl isomerase
MKNKILIIILVTLSVACEKPKPRLPIIKKSVLQDKTIIALNNKIKVEQELLFKRIIKNDTLKTYSSSKHGFWYAYNFKGKGNYLPKKGDELIYVYSVYNVKNQLIYPKKEVHYWVDKQDVMDGLEVGLKLMKEGDEVTFLFPSNVAYGYSGDQNKIGINQPLIFKVKLNKINKNESN